jgi:hypothetical protein
MIGGCTRRPSTTTWQLLETPARIASFPVDTLNPTAAAPLQNRAKQGDALAERPPTEFLLSH